MYNLYNIYKNDYINIISLQKGGDFDFVSYLKLDLDKIKTRNKELIKKNTPVKNSLGYKNIMYYLCFFVLNLPPLISFSKKDPKASPTSVNSTPVAPS